MDESLIWSMLDKYFEENPNSLVSHNLDSYNDFFNNGIYRIFKEKNPVRLESNYDKTIDDYRNKCEIYCGGINGDKIYFGKPIIHDNNNTHYMFPNEARIRNMTYAMTIHYDVDVVFKNILKDGEEAETVGGGFEDENADEENVDSHKVSYKFKNYKSEKYDESEKNDEITGGAIKKIDRKRVIKNYELTVKEASEIREKTRVSMLNSKTQTNMITIEKVFLGKFPIMVQSNYCILNGLTPEVRHSMGECRQDQGGYFIIQGKEKAVVSQEKFADNMLHVSKYIKEVGDDEVELDNLYSVEMRSVSENASKPIRKISLLMVAPSNKFTNKNIVLNIPNVRKPVPLFIIMRALGINTDKEIISICLLDIDKYDAWVNDFIPSIHDAGGILTQKLAIDYIASLTKGKRFEHGMEILTDYLLPHIGETNYIEKAYFIGHMVYKMLSVSNNAEQPTDRDNYKFKRVELVGSLLYNLFRDYYTLQQNHIRLEYDKRLNFNLNLYSSNMNSLINTYKNEIFNERIIEKGFSKAFKGNWGAKPNTKIIGVVQDLNRLSFNGYLSHLRKTNVPMAPAGRVVGPRLLHGSQWGLIDPLDTPDGGNVGLHKSLAIMTKVTQGGIGIRKPLIDWLREKAELKYVYECSPKILSFMTKVFVNGYWAGSLLEPLEKVEKIKLYRRNGLLSIYTSVGYDIKYNIINIYTDGGRLCRPIFYKDDMTNKISYENVIDKLKKGDFLWENLILGFNKIKENLNYEKEKYKIYQTNTLFKDIKGDTNPSKIDTLIKNKNVIDYIDSNETEHAMISLTYDDYHKKPHTHLELHQSLMFGTMGSLIVYPENNPPARNLFSCGQSKQACSIYHTNFHVRFDKSAIVLNYGQTPLVKTRFLDYINKEETPYGENVIVAIMCYGGYNMEDSVLINEGSLKRGMYNTTYYTSYEAHEEINDTTDGNFITSFSNIESDSEINGLKVGYDYSKLDKYGMVREGTIIDDKTILVGMVKSGSDGRVDVSIVTKKGQVGIVDKSFITEGEEGYRIAKIRIRDIRIPTLGDKVGSRHGQKGTCGLVVPEADMPFGNNGTRPDIIINPHAIPSRMTIGQLVESLAGKTSSLLGSFADGTAFVNNGLKAGVYGEILTKQGFHSSGNEMLYNGQTGEQMETEIFIGPTYYMRLKHMVKDKINYRSKGPNTAMTRQPVSGRANDGGLRIGEMERDSLISHGITDFLRESMMERSDKYSIAVCNNTGITAIYNNEKNIFMSPMADGPIKFTGSIEDGDMNIVNVTKFGRDFSIVDVPYSFKLLIQELNTINVNMRIITEDNIDQIENMSFSKNLELLGTKGPLEYRYAIKIKRQEANREANEKAFKLTPEPEPIDVPRTPEYAPPQSPEYAPPQSPEYAPPQSPEYAPPQSPEYAPPQSPEYAPPQSADNTILGGYTHTNNDTFKMGDIVYYKGLNKHLTVKDRWTIVKIENNLITIVISSALARKDKLKNSEMMIVESKDIEKENRYPVRSTGGYEKPLEPLDGKMFSYAPVININTGGDERIKTNFNQDDYSRDIEDIREQEGGGIRFKEETEDNDKGKSNNDSDNNDTIDFNNLVIKKL